MAHSKPRGRGLGTGGERGRVFADVVERAYWKIRYNVTTFAEPARVDRLLDVERTVHDATKEEP